MNRSFSRSVPFAGVLKMTTRKLCFWSTVFGLFVHAIAGTTSAGEDAPRPWDRTKAGQYLDGRGEEWFKFGSAHRGEGKSESSCISCHSLLSYALARPVLRRLSHEEQPTKFEARLLEQTKRRVASWDQLDTPPFQLLYDFDEDKKKQSRGTEAVLNALVLALNDRAEGRQESSEITRKAIGNLWSTQLKDGPNKGSWDWLNFGMDPWESDNSPYMGAALAAIAVGSPPGNDPASAGAGRQGLESLRNYLKKHYDKQNLHNRIWLLWASTRVDGVLTQKEKQSLTEQILAKQQESGGWSLSSLGRYARKDVTQVTAPDGYATGLALHALQVAGTPKDKAQVAKGLSWLKANQDPTGAWRAPSVNKNRTPESKDQHKAHIGKFMWDAATAYSVLALSD
jgi:squalene-hopene/tetraprenyl-beta-curcumene cyclase